MLKCFRKITALALSAVMVLSVSTATVVSAGAVESAAVGSGEDLVFGDYEYQILDDGTVEITDYNGSDAELVIPSEIDGKSVTSIGDDAFNNCTGLTSITIPDSVTSISGYAFYGCRSLTSVKIPNSVTSIGDGAFEYCENLISMTIPESVINIGEYAFRGCAGLTSISVSKENPIFVSIDGIMFDKDMTTLLLYPAASKNAYYSIPDSVTNIGSGAFFDCSGLTSVIIPDSVTSIGVDAFNNCTGLTSVTVPDSVTSLGKWAFSRCSGLTSVVISNNVKKIQRSTFYGCTGLKTITIPNSVTSLGKWAFVGCTGLTKITIPDSVISIDEYAFLETAWYDNQPDGLVYAGKVAYKYKGEMPENTEIVLKDGTSGIADSAFDGCTGLTSITIPDSVISVGKNALSGTAWYDNQPDGVVYAGKVAYTYKCEGEIKGGVLPEITEIVLKDGTKGIADDAFARCWKLTSVTIPNGVISIGEYAFVTPSGALPNFQSELTSVTIPDSVTIIENYAFGYCVIGEGYGERGYGKSDNFTITGYEGTAAETYAKENGFKFIALEPEIVHGDVDGNGKVTLVDAINIQKSALNMLELSGQSRINADVNGDGKVNVLDAILAQKIALNIAINA